MMSIQRWITGGVMGTFNPRAGRSTMEGAVRNRAVPQAEPGALRLRIIFFVGGFCFDGVMSSPATSFAPGPSPTERLDVLFDELAELTGQRNAIDGRIVAIVAEIDHDELAGATGARSIPALVAWRTGVSPRNAEIIAAIAQRLPQFPRCAKGMAEGRFSL